VLKSLDDRTQENTSEKRNSKIKRKLITLKANSRANGRRLACVERCGLRAKLLCHLDFAW